MFKKLKGKVFRARATPACMCGLETVVLIKQQQQLQVCENYWVRRTKRLDKRRMSNRKSGSTNFHLTLTHVQR